MRERTLRPVTREASRECTAARHDGLCENRSEERTIACKSSHSAAHAHVCPAVLAQVIFVARADFTLLQSPRLNPRGASGPAVLHLLTR